MGFTRNNNKSVGGGGFTTTPLNKPLVCIPCQCKYLEDEGAIYNGRVTINISTEGGGGAAFEKENRTKENFLQGLLPGILFLLKK